jgi:hypothetical protein
MPRTLSERPLSEAVLISIIICTTMVLMTLIVSFTLCMAKKNDSQEPPAKKRKTEKLRDPFAQYACEHRNCNLTFSGKLAKQKETREAHEKKSTLALGSLQGPTLLGLHQALWNKCRL